MSSADHQRSETSSVAVQKSFAARDKPGTLYLVATPIGNLEDMTFRAIRTLKEVDLIAAEDTRQSRKLLTHFEISNRLVSYHEHNKEASGPELLRLLSEGNSIALISDAGLPAISDPGADLAAEAAALGIPVVPIPGANAALSALIISALPTDRFLFAGFPPRDRKGMDRFLDGIGSEPGTVILYEAPHRLKKTIEAIAARWGHRRMAIVRELTKRYEEVVRGTAEACARHLEEVPPLGECVLLLEGTASAGSAWGSETGTAASEPGSWWSALSLAEHVDKYEAESGNRKEAMRLAARDRGLSRRDVYQALLKQE
ncbi:16S rRNA (cytidine(1402)-2'-O)-methyltransferase [Cohnella thailandensis]|uniref:Ribosomal RNA small subunit methyltransferase I n=1 Tax=Cohnella thailandensis TaxID=557557 RepID=A0A841T5Y0_9BACL|nr:16S rRNA (cytidine(1402)-2'-O)-methyltransferase [Cohnella thailandensis]MBB6638266.1 16S rRNA (cytidine(1402)-2'-O)-methyltransferase [Cohnella thailandensis]MBP1977688.1 16S rRNA (cytidine1402-2'-O)-methyltransferase [Cohnella thailandensis]